VQGIVRMALAGFDVACWDALGVAANLPLARMLGAEPRPVPAYNSCGLGLMDDLGSLAAEAETLLQGGFRAVKLRLGYPTLDQDIAAIRAVRKRIGESVHLMVDYNQALSVEEALVRGRAMRKISIGWRSQFATTTMPAPPRSRARSKSRSRSARIFLCRPRWRSRSSRAPPIM
jgi:mandelate racemase